MLLLQFTCVDVCPESAPRQYVEQTENGTSTICLTDALYDEVIGGRSDLTHVLLAEYYSWMATLPYTQIPFWDPKNGFPF